MSPPKIPERLLSWVIRDELREEVLGDLEEKFYRNLKVNSLYRSRIHYWYQAINYFRLFALKRSKPKYFNQTVMVKNYFFTAFRNISKNKFHASLNILSLAIGIAACIVIFLFIREERSFDTQHSLSENIYRLCEVQSFPGTNTQKVALSMPGMAPAFLSDFPEVRDFTRYWGMGKRMWERGDKRILLEQGARVDSSFLILFDFEMISGDRKEALVEPNSIVITRETALKFFDDLDVLGESLVWNEDSYEITGVIEDIPEQSHLQFDLLMSFTTYTSQDPELNNRWGSNFMVTYLHLIPDPDFESMTERYPNFLLDNSGIEQINDFYKLFLQPLSEVHLGSMDIEHDYQNYRKFNGAYLDVFTLVAIFIIIIAAVNFMNLTTARASTRAKEVGVRKSIGALKGQLFRQFIIESVILAMLGLLVALIIDLISLPLLNDAINRNLALQTIFVNPDIILIILLSVILLGVVSGLYPAIYLSSFQTVRVLKGIDRSEKRSFFRSSLIVTQFSLAMAMIVATFVVLDQLNFMRTKDIGFNKDHIMLVDMNSTANDKFDLIKEQLLQNSNIIGVTASGQRLGENFHQWGFQAEVDTGILNITPSNVLVEYDYLDVYEIELVAGRTFSKEYARDDGLAFIINESFAKELGYDDPIGKRVGHSWYPSDSLGTIIGVTKDFNFNSLHYEVNTLSMVVHSEWYYDEMSIRLNGQNIEAGISEVERIWSEQVPDYPLDYSFLDGHFNELYESDQQMSAVVSIMAVLSIIVGAMGLFGLSAMSIERRIKEIGIRKVLGAGTRRLIIILSSDFAILIGISFLIAAPATYYFLQKWLENFAYRTELNLWLFGIAGIVTFVIAMGTISFHTLRAAATNPAETLKYE